MSDTKRRCSTYGVGVLQRARALLWMEYSAEEIARKLQVLETDVASWISDGAPSRTDDAGQNWIVGTQLRDWLLATNNAAHGLTPLPPGMAFCTRCGARRRIVEPIQRREVGGSLWLVEGRCATCGSVVHRGEEESNG